MVNILLENQMNDQKNLKKFLSQEWNERMHCANLAPAVLHFTESVQYRLCCATRLSSLFCLWPFLFMFFFLYLQVLHLYKYIVFTFLWNWHLIQTSSDKCATTQCELSGRASFWSQKSNCSLLIGKEEEEQESSTLVLTKSLLEQRYLNYFVWEI